MKHTVLVPGNSLSLEGGFLGLSTIALIETDAGAPILFDCGHHVTLGPMLSALKSHRLAPEDIGTLVLSHLHFDHATNIDHFPNAEIVVTAEELAYSDAPHPEDNWVASAITHRLANRNVRVLGGPEEIVPGLRTVPTPGHTPGHIALAYTRADGARVTLAADAMKTLREAISGVPDLDFDPQSRGGESLRKILDESDIIVPGHHPELHRTPEGFGWEDLSSITLVVR